MRGCLKVLGCWVFLMVSPSASAAQPGDSGLAAIPGGCVMLGCEGAACPKETPVPHKECLPSFALQKTEVTVAEYDRCVAAQSCRPALRGGRCNAAVPGRERHPVNCVSFDDATSYCRFVGQRLPSAAEWERAARGLGAARYPWGNEPPTCQRANIMSCAAAGAGGGTEPTGSHPTGASAEGVEDLLGNVAEYVASPKAASPEDPSGAATPTKMVLFKGGSYSTNPELLLAAFQHPISSDQNRLPFVGFRCAADASAPAASAVSAARPPQPVETQLASVTTARPSENPADRSLVFFASLLLFLIGIAVVLPGTKPRLRREP